MSALTAWRRPTMTCGTFKRRSAPIPWGRLVHRRLLTVTWSRAVLGENVWAKFTRVARGVGEFRPVKFTQAYLALRRRRRSAAPSLASLSR